MPEERRKSPRIKKALIVMYASPNEADGSIKKWNMTAVQNISELGMRINIDENLQVGDILLFQIKLPLRPHEWQQIKGQVMEMQNLKTGLDIPVAKEYTARIEFLELKKEQKQLLSEYVHWFLQQSGGG